MRPLQVTSVLLLLMVVSSTVALQCYQCFNCGNSAGTLSECDSDSEVCMKSDLAGIIVKDCGKKKSCGIQGTLQGIFSKWNNMISSVHEDLTIPDGTGSRMIECCESDYCNSAMPKLVNPIILLLPMFMYLLQR